MNSAAAKSTNIMVSVAMITYNHEAFIAQAIESVIMQKTDFTVELVIGEDCSTDATRAIVQSFEDQFPDRINVLFPNQNLGMIPNFVATLEKCRGQYIAVCEGDDYWTDPLKLQRQVDFMEANPDCSMCFHWTCQLNEMTGEIEIIRLMDRKIKPFYTLKDVVRTNFIPTASTLFRKSLVPKLPDWYFTAPVGDWPLFVLYAQKGKVGLLNQIMSVSRIHPGGIWSNALESNQNKMALGTYDVFYKYLGPDYYKVIKKGISEYFLTQASSYATRGNLEAAKRNFHRSIAEFPLIPSTQIIDILVLYGRLYMPWLYWRLKRLQIKVMALINPHFSNNKLRDVREKGNS